ncbi:MAG: glycosyltransferase family 9 protein [Bacteroidota bacterium]
MKEIKEQIGCKVYLLASSNNYFIFENTKLADEIIIYRKNFKGILYLIKLINSIGLDVIVDLHDDVSSTVSYLIAFIKSDYKFALKKNNEKLFTHTIDKLDPSKYHVIDRVLEFGKLFNIKIDYSKANVIFSPSDASIQKSELFLKKNFAEKKFLLGINISAGSDARFWGVQNFKRLILELSSYDINLVLLCAEKDLKNAMDIAGNKIPIFYRHIFTEFSAMIQKLDMLFTPDTSIVHIASAFEKPVFGLYVKYQTKDKIWSPYKSPFDCILTEEATLHNVSFKSVKEKFIPFLEKFYSSRV